ncbi:hypothetical protein [Streptomyces sp. NPDC007070]|uniref:hypothetical protein n=1 Tax=Streptomyces sp. NPDC007070 TaxID=3154312 RepID=UPI0033DE5453
MTNLETRTRPVPADQDADLATLRGDCARMAPRWSTPERHAARPVPPSRIHGVSVPASAARLLDATAEYGD